jgi:hypothetical protein
MANLRSCISKDATMHGCKKVEIRGMPRARSLRQTSQQTGNIRKQKSLLVVFEMG